MIAPAFNPMRTLRAHLVQWLVEGAQSGDSLFFHYSGHGTHQKDVSPDKDESDGQDEALCPSDYPTAGLIVDDDLHEVCGALMDVSRAKQSYVRNMLDTVAVK